VAGLLPGGGPLNHRVSRAGVDPAATPAPGRDRLTFMAGPEQSAFIGAVAIGVGLFVVGAVAIRAGGGWAALGWVLMVIVVLGAIGAVGSRFTRG
jgi:hypothetical protein